MTQLPENLITWRTARLPDATAHPAQKDQFADVGQKVTSAPGPITIRIAYSVFGEPVPQGSTRVVPMRAKGGGYQTRPDGRPLLRPIHSKDKPLRAWRADVAAGALAQYSGGLIDGPIRLTVTFARPRPAGHFGTGKNAGRLRASAPPLPTTRPDSIKLLRAIEDALSGVVWRDDSQVVEHFVSKRYGQGYVTDIVIEALKQS